MILSVAVLAMAASPAGAGCSALTIGLTPGLKRTEAARVTALAHQKVRAGDISLVMAEGPWRLVWATPADAERGVFFFRRAGKGWQLVDTWGGVLPPDERQDGVDWARKLAGRPSPRLAGCFADAVVAGH